MRISLNWLQELVDITLTPEILAETLTMAGFEVESIEDRRTWAEGVVVGRILDCQPHPNADKLRVCQVDIGAATPSTIVCGAPNARSDIYVPVATLGTYLPRIDLKIKPAKLRGVASEGMICSLAELGLTKDSEGIHIFEQPVSLGSDVRPLLGLDDVILDVTSTANRADALSMVGLAREVSALTGGKLTLPEIPEPTIPQSTEAAVNIKIAEPKACPIYIGTLIRQVKISPSPDWLQKRLKAAGVRPINNVVDVTNYVLLEWGQPLHAFDYDRLTAPSPGTLLKIGVRFADTNESLKTLDGQDRTLSDQSLLITAHDRPVALAGVMGGEETEVSAETTQLFLEAAVFDPATIRRSARGFSLRTEASARYERGVNQAELAIACNRALQLIQELAGGEIQSQSQDSHQDASSWNRSIELRLDWVNQVLGPVELGDEVGELQAQDVERILTTLGCTLSSTETPGVWHVTVPPYRYRDLEREIDLIEEIARLYGYNKFCDTLPDKTEPGYLSIDQELIRRLRAAFRATGLTELMHYSLVKPEGERQITLTNPLFTEYSALRTDLLSGLIEAFEYNWKQGNGPLNGFEIGRIFWREEIGLEEADVIAGVFGGDLSRGKWVRAGREAAMTWFEAKGLLESVFTTLGVAVEYQPDRRDPRLHPGRTASLWIRGQRLGTFGQLHPQLRQQLDLPDAVYAFEFDLATLLEQMDQDENLVPPFKPYSTYPSSSRDLAFFAPVQPSVVEIERVMKKAAGSLLESVELFDEYRGEHVPSGQRSLAFRLQYRSSDRTLEEGDVEPVHQKVRDALVEKFQVELRS